MRNNAFIDLDSNELLNRIVDGYLSYDQSKFIDVFNLDYLSLLCNNKVASGDSVVGWLSCGLFIYRVKESLEQSSLFETQYEATNLKLLAITKDSDVLSSELFDLESVLEWLISQIALSPRDLESTVLGLEKQLTQRKEFDEGMLQNLRTCRKVKKILSLASKLDELGFLPEEHSLRDYIELSKVSDVI